MTHVERGPSHFGAVGIIAVTTTVMMMIVVATVAMNTDPMLRWSQGVLGFLGVFRCTVRVWGGESVRV